MKDTEITDYIENFIATLHQEGNPLANKADNVDRDLLKEIFKAGLQVNSDCNIDWHNIIENPDDLPSTDTTRFTYVQKKDENDYTKYEVIDTWAAFEKDGKITTRIGEYNCATKKFDLQDYFGTVIAWAELPVYNKVEKGE